MFGASRFLTEAEFGEAAGTFDVILNTASGHGALDEYFALLKPRGVLACVGLPSKGEQSRLYLQSAVLTEKALVGSYLGPYEDYEEMLAFVAQHGIRPQVELFSVRHINDAIAHVRENRARYRVVLAMEDK